MTPDTNTPQPEAQPETQKKTRKPRAPKTMAQPPAEGKMVQSPPQAEEIVEARWMYGTFSAQSRDSNATQAIEPAYWQNQVGEWVDAIHSPREGWEGLVKISTIAPQKPTPKPDHIPNEMLAIVVFAAYRVYHGTGKSVQRMEDRKLIEGFYHLLNAHPEHPISKALNEARSIVLKSTGCADCIGKIAGAILRTHSAYTKEQRIGNTVISVLIAKHKDLDPDAQRKALAQALA